MQSPQGKQIYIFSHSIKQQKWEIRRKGKEQRLNIQCRKWGKKSQMRERKKMQSSCTLWGLVYVKHGPGEATQLRPFFASIKTLYREVSGIRSNSYYYMELQYSEILLLILKKVSSSPIASELLYPLAVALLAWFLLKLCYFSEVCGFCFFQSRIVACIVPCFPYIFFFVNGRYVHSQIKIRT